MKDYDYEDNDDYPNPVLVIVECIIERETEKALLVQQDGVTVWIPRSQCSHISKRPHPNSFSLRLGKITLPEWLAEDKNLIYT